MTSVEVLIEPPLTEKPKLPPASLPHAVLNPEPSLVIFKIFAALFYAIASLLITIINKSILTSYQFPSFQVLAIGQMITTVVVLYLAKKTGRVKFPNFHFRIFYQLFPLPLIYAGNMIFGLGSTKELSLPMFTLLRRLSIFLTMVLEYFLLKVYPGPWVQLSVGMMVFGAAIGALRDLAFNVHGYTFVLVNNVLTAAHNVVIKQKLDTRSEMGKYGLMYYCSLFMLPLAMLMAWQTDDLRHAAEYKHWLEFSFLVQFSASCTMGFVLMYSIMLCTQFNSALTTTIIGCLKNILVTYLGMFIGGDYIFSVENFIGINVSIAGSLLYSWVTFKPSAHRAEKQPVASNI